MNNMIDTNMTLYRSLRRSTVMFEIFRYTVLVMRLQIHLPAIIMGHSASKSISLKFGIKF